MVQHGFEELVQQVKLWSRGGIGGEGCRGRRDSASNAVMVQLSLRVGSGGNAVSR